MSSQKLGLFALRLSLTIFFAVWAIEKFIKPDTTAAIWKSFYLVESLPATGSYVVGGVQSLVIVLFFFGIARFWTYGFLLVTHGIGTLLTYEKLLNPYESINHLFIAAIPVFGALLALFLMRGEDTLFTLGRR
ncbi:MAG: hypothetical protein ACFB00_13695 [Parvularculaceae bacterium]